MTYFYQTSITKSRINRREEEITGDEGYVFCYVPDEVRKRQALAEIIFKYYFDCEADKSQIIKSLINLVYDNGINEAAFEDDLHDYFADEAMRAFENGDIPDCDMKFVR